MLIVLLMLKNQPEVKYLHNTQEFVAIETATIIVNILLNTNNIQHEIHII